MKILSCFNSYNTLSLQKRFVFENENFDKSFDAVFEQTAKDAEASETNVYFKDIRENAVLVTDGVVEGIVSERKTAVQKKIDDLDTKISKLPKGSAQAKKLEADKAALVAEKADLESKDGALRKTLVAAQKGALGRLETKFNDANKKREDAAKKFADEFKQSLQAQMIDSKYADQEKEASWDSVTTLMRGVGLRYQKGVAMPRWEKKADGGIVNTGGPDWNKDNVLEATAEMLQNTYVELGPKAAMAKLKAFKENQGDSGINYFTWNTVFGTETGRGSFAYVLGSMCFDTNKGSKLFGEVVGKMNAANEIFKGDKNAKFFDQYEAAVKAAIDKGEEVPSPTMWAKENAPEVLTKHEAPEEARDTLISSVIERVTRQLNYNSKDNGDRLRAIEWHLRGALAAEPDPKKYDAMVKKVLLGMMGAESGDVDFKKLAQELDYTKIVGGPEIYGDVKGKLPAKFLYAQSGLVRGLDYNYGDKEVEVMKDGKTVKMKFAAYYKEYLGGVMKRKGEVGEAINDEYTEHVARQNALLLRYSGKTVPQEELDALEKQHDDAVRLIMQTKVVKPADLLDQLETAKKKEEPKVEEAPKEDDKSKGKKATGGGGAKAPAAKGGDAPAPKPAPKKEGGGTGGQPVAQGGDKKAPDAPKGKPDEGAPKQPAPNPDAPKPAVEVASASAEVPPKVKKRVIKIVSDVAKMPRPKAGYTPQDAQDKVNEGVADLPAGLVQPNGKLTFRHRDMTIEVTADDQGKYQGKIVAASPIVKGRFGLDVPEIAPKEKPGKKVAGKKGESDSKAS